MAVTDQIRAKLEAAFSPSFLEVVDESEKHRGHAGWREGGETHFQVSMRTAAFNGLNRVAQQRAVYGALKDEMKDQIHALALDVAGEDA
jgi:BolA family transcriptional regulator, general stress-responsive regulator